MTGIVVACFLLGAAGAWGISRYAGRFGLIDLPNDRSSHAAPTPRGGGIGILVAFSLAALFGRVSLFVWVPVVVLSLVSFFDDRLDLKAQTRLIVQFVAALVVCSALFFSALPFGTAVVLLLPASVYIVGTANFFNFMDGINGIAGITGAVAFALVASFGTLSEVSPTVIFLSVGISAACLGFLPFNMPRAKVFMGDVGSILLGFFFAVSVFLSSHSFADFLCLTGFLFPFYADTLTTLFLRWREGERLSQAHRRHVYQVLVNELGFVHWQVSLGYGIMQVLFGLLMLVAWKIGVALQLFLWCSGFILFILCARIVRKNALISGN